MSVVDGNILEVDKVIVSRQNPVSEEAAPPATLEYGELALDINGKAYAGNKNNQVVPIGGDDKEWSEIDVSLEAEPPTPKVADQLNGYTAQDIITEAVKATTLVDELSIPEPPPPDNDADTLNGYTAEEIIKEGKKAETLNGLTSTQIIENNGINIYTHSKSGTVHEFTGKGANGRAKMTAEVQAGDTFTVNGAPVTAYVGTDDAAGSMAGNAWDGKWITFVVEDGILNFKGGGGKVTVSGLSADAVKKGTTATVKQGAKVVANILGTYEMSVKENKGATFAWNGVQSQSVIATHTIKKHCTVIAASFVDFAPGSSILEAAGYVKLNGNEAPGRISTAYYKRCVMYMFEANPGDMVTVYSQGRTTQSYGTVNAIIMTDE